VKDYEAGWIHHEICQKLEKFEKDIIEKKSPRLMLFMPPRHGKSELASTQFPAWFLGRNPNKEIISCSYSATLAMSFSRKVRQLLRDPRYQSIFPNTELGKDSQSTENWLTTEGGGYLASGVGGPITGRGAHALIIDDPVKNRAEAESASERERVWDWYSSTAYTRLAPGGGVLLILTRWHTDDLAGRLLAEMKAGRGDDWEIVVYPATAVHDEKYRKVGEALHPERYDKKSLAMIKEALTPRDWGALYQQDPSTEEGAILKRTLWNRWEDERPPTCEYVIQSYDTAYGQSESSDFTVITTWGLFKPDGNYSRHTLCEAHGPDPMFNGDATHIILLDAVKGRYPFPELKDRAYMLNAFWKPESIVVEAKAAGLPLIQEMRKMGIPVQPFTPSRGNDKMARVHSISDLFASGYVWAPRTAWADDLIEECHKFPAGKHDDQVDSTTQALMRFRQGGFIQLMTDDNFEEFKPRRRMAYY
jgi:predicted phage terminase large subunit-like protein